MFWMRCDLLGTKYAHTSFDVRPLKKANHCPLSIRWSTDTGRRLAGPARLLSCLGSADHMARPSSLDQLQAALKSEWKLILGSASRSRRGIMDSLSRERGFDYEIVTADIDEKAIGDRAQNPEVLVLELARAKAAAIQHKLGGIQSKSLLVTCDQVVVHQGHVLEKPTSPEEAWSMIRSYASGPAQTVGSVICTNLLSSKAAEALDIAEVSIRPIPDEAIEQMVNEGFVFHCAGALMIEHPLVAPYIDNINGTVDGVMGIDKRVALKMMAEALQL